MATFTFGRDIDIHWNGYDIQGTAGTVFSIPDQLYEEFDADIAPVEPTLVWVDTNEFQTLTNNVSASTLSASFPIALTTTTSGKTISLSSSTNPNGYLLAADGSGGIIFTPASTSGLTSVVGTSPISSLIAGGTATVSIDQAAITGATAATNAQVVRFYVKNTTGTTIPKGSAVYVSGATGDNALISLASATSDPSSSKTLGITAEAIATDAFGYVIEAGYLTDIDTSATTAGAAVWLGDAPGSLVFVNPPAEPSHAVYLGVVVRVQSNNGSILVKVQNGYELDELHDVFVGGVSTALPLVYNGTSSGWIAQELSSVGIADGAVTSSKVSSVTGTGDFVLGNDPTLSLPVINNPKLGYETTAISNSTATLSNTSPYYQFFTGSSGTLIIHLPVASTMALGQGFDFNNNATQNVTIRTSSGSSVIVIGPGLSYRVLCILTSGTAASSWDVEGISAVQSGYIIANAVGSAALANNAVVAAKINAAAVNTAKIDSTGGSNGWVLTANGSGGVSFTAASSAAEAYYITGAGTVNGSSLTSIPSGRYQFANWTGRNITVAQGATTSTVIATENIIVSQKSSMTATLPIGWSWNTIDAGTTTAAYANKVKYLNSAWYLPLTSGAISRSTNGTSFTVSAALVTTGELRDIGYGGSTFVACGNGGGIISSTDGTSWTVRTSGTTQPLNGVAHGDGTFLIVGNSGSALTSTDGTTWTPRTTGSNSTWVGVAYGSSLFVAIQNSAIRTTPDGVTWTARTVTGTLSGNLSRISFANGVFVIVSSTGEIVTSSDGITWTEVFTSPVSGGSGLAYLENSLWITSHNNGRFCYSFDNAVTWQEISSLNNSPISLSDIDDLRLGYGNNRLIASNDNGTNPLSFTSTTSDEILFSFISLTEVTA